MIKDRIWKITLVFALVASVATLIWELKKYFVGMMMVVAVGLPIFLLFLFIGVLFVRRSVLWPRSYGYAWALIPLTLGFGTQASSSSVGDALEKIAHQYGWDVIFLALRAGYSEELWKTAMVFIVIMAFSRIDRPWHGLVVGVLVGLGYSGSEHYLYTSNAAFNHPYSDLSGALHQWGMRILITPFSHSVYTGLAGWGLGLALLSRGRSLSWRVSTAAVWIMAGFGLHFAWDLENVPDSVGAVLLLTLFILNYVCLFVAWRRAAKMARSETSTTTTEEPDVAFVTSAG